MSTCLRVYGRSAKPHCACIIFIVEPFHNESYAGPGPGDGYWGSWAWQIESVDASERRIIFGAGGHQTTRGALNGGPWYVEGIKEELTGPGTYCTRT
jgi:hypothetical protein